MHRMEPGDGKAAAQLRRGVVEYCVLALVADQPRYGLDIARALHDAGLIDGEGTVYPLLSRLRSRGIVDTRWEESTSGPPRRYYRLTRAGVSSLDDFRVGWARFRDAVDTLMGAPQ